LWIWFVHSFLKLSKTDISANLRLLLQSPAPLLRSTKEDRQGQDAEQDTEKRTRDGEPEGNVPASGSILSSCCFLERSKIDISQKVKFLARSPAGCLEGFRGWL
jgi:hypothetical protein